MDYKKVGQFLSKLRKEKDLTQANLAEVLNVTHQAVSRWETGESIPDVQTLENISQFYNVTIDEILKGEYREKQITELEKQINSSFYLTLNKVKKQHIISFIIAVISIILFYWIGLRRTTGGTGLIIQKFLLIISIIVFYLGYYELKKLILKNYQNDSDSYHIGFQYLIGSLMSAIILLLISFGIYNIYGHHPMVSYISSTFFIIIYDVLNIISIVLGLSLLLILIIDMNRLK